jgi:phosphatidate cytidylyltransferase
MSVAPQKAAGGGFADLGPRVASAVALGAAAIGALYVGGDVFALFWLVAAFAVNWEWQGLVGGERRLARVIAGGAAVAAAAAFGRNGWAGTAALEVALFAAVAAVLGGPEKRLW